MGDFRIAPALIRHCFLFSGLLFPAMGAYSQSLATSPRPEPVVLADAATPRAALPDAPAPDPALLANLASLTPSPEASPQQPFPPQQTRRHGLPLLGLNPGYVPVPHACRAQACSQLTPHQVCCQPQSGTFGAYLEQNAVHIYTPRELAQLAARSVADPFNLLTIAGTSAFTVATDAHSPYGPGMDGWAKLSGVLLTQDMTGEFFGTFLIPSIDHEYPHYVRMPNAPLPRRIAHCLYQPFWTVSDTGQGMVNYSNIVGTIADEAVDITYVPYQQMGWGPSAERVVTAWATAPIGNFITEFVPDVARHFNVNIVFVQRIIDRVADEEGGMLSTTPVP
jgi:hypothetical protein